MVEPQSIMAIGGALVAVQMEGGCCEAETVMVAWVVVSSNLA